MTKRYRCSPTLSARPSHRTDLALCSNAAQRQTLTLRRSLNSGFPLGNAYLWVSFCIGAILYRRRLVNFSKSVIIRHPIVCILMSHSFKIVFKAVRALPLTRDLQGQSLQQVP